MSSIDAEYIEWLKSNSMLQGAKELSRKFSGNKSQWVNGFADPKSKQAVAEMPVWFNSYPDSTMPFEGQNFLEFCGDERLWTVLNKLGVSLLRTGPEKVAGGIEGKEQTPTVDGYFDRIKLEIAPAFGTDEQYAKMVTTAKKFSGQVAGDIIPGHTGKGYDFRLAERNYDEYPGIYTMVEVDEADWNLLPEVNDEWKSGNIHPDNVIKLAEKGYIPGNLQRVLFSVPGDTRPLSGWDATAKIEGVDGKVRRWAFLHYFKSGQPSMNWLDPTSAANRIIYGDVIKSLRELGARMVRLDANSFLGIERSMNPNRCWSEGHPLSVNASNSIAMFARKLGGLTFQELNLAIDKIKEFSILGADLSYDFVTRPALQHAILTKSTNFLRLSYDLMKEHDIAPVSMIHDMQNHDEITYELVHFIENPYHEFDYDGEKIFGDTLRNMIIEEMHDIAINGDVKYNALSGNGLCTTFAGLIATRLGITDINKISKQDKEKIKKLHLLMAAYNALQPGVFGLSGWDLVGALPIDQKDIPEFVADGDTRWINRGGYDLLDANPNAEKSIGGLPKAKSLYGSVTEQLKDPDSFVNGLRKIISQRQEYSIHLADIMDITQPEDKDLFVMLHRLPDGDLQFTLLNFGDEDKEATLKIRGGVNDKFVYSAGDEKPLGKIEKRNITVKVKAMDYVCAIIEG